MHIHGDGVKQNQKIAIRLYKKACDGGYAEGCFNVGSMYYNGKYIRQDKKVAKELYGKACDEGYDMGCKNYKILNEQGV